MPEESTHYLELLKTVSMLRAPGGCPWDREQTHLSLTECLIEECSELIEAIDNSDTQHMREELGDVLLNVVMQTEIAAEAGNFDMEAVCKEVNEKLIRRHPHVFGPDGEKLENAGEVLKRWDEIKATEKNSNGEAKPKSAFKPQPPQLPALLFAKKNYKYMEKAGVQDSEALPLEQIREVNDDWSEDEIARMLFSISAACRRRGLDPEAITRAYTKKLVDGFVEQGF